MESTKSLIGLKKSGNDRIIAGICGGLGEGTQIPPWLWRAIFFTSTFIGGIGLIAYISLFIFMPWPGHSDTKPTR